MRPSKSLSCGRGNFVLETSHEVLIVDVVCPSKRALDEVAFLGNYVSHCLSVDLPLLHLVSSWKFLSVLGEEIFVGDEGCIGVEIYGSWSKLRENKHADIVADWISSWSTLNVIVLNGRRNDWKE